MALWARTTGRCVPWDVLVPWCMCSSTLGEGRYTLDDYANLRSFARWFWYPDDSGYHFWDFEMRDLGPILIILPRAAWAEYEKNTLHSDLLDSVNMLQIVAFAVVNLDDFAPRFRDQFKANLQWFLMVPTCPRWMASIVSVSAMSCGKPMGFPRS